MPSPSKTLPLVVTLLCGLEFTTSCKHPSLSGASATKELEQKRAALLAVPIGAQEADVIAQIGRPDEMRPAALRRFVGEAYRWAYGAEGKGSFAVVGVVIFATNRTVMGAFSPTKPSWQREESIGLPLVRTAQRSKKGLSCVIDSVETQRLPSNASIVDISLMNPVTFSLVNDGPEPYAFKQAKLDLKFGCVVEVYDARKRLIQRDDLGRLALGLTSLRDEWKSILKDEWKTITVPAHGRLTETLDPWLTDFYFGRPPAGKYYMRLLHEFDNEGFYSSNLVEFQISE